MGGRRGYGPTHSQTLDPLLMNVPGLSIVAPSLFHNAGALLSDVVLNTERPVLFIENKLLYPMSQRLANDLGKVDDFFVRHLGIPGDPGATISLTLSRASTPDITVIAYGGMAHLAAEAALTLFFEEEILAEVIVPARIKPFDIDDFLPSVMESGRVLVVEESVQSHGWGAEVAARIQQRALGSLNAPIARLGAKDLPIPSSRPMEDEVLPQMRDIVESMQKLMEIQR
jgi:pyruvate/2-oxoglutarate/acetoin dehydrogenase E1 component